MRIAPCRLREFSRESIFLRLQQKSLPRISRMNTNNRFAYFAFIRGKFFFNLR